MIFQFGADVRDPDGGKLGSLRRMVLNLESCELTHLVVDHNELDSREVVVPADDIDESDEESVRTDLWDEDFEKLAIYATYRNVAPPPDAGQIGSDLIHDPVDVPDTPPIGAATGVESIAFTPLVEENVHIPPGGVVVDSSTRVWAIDGEVGRVKQIRVNDDTFEVTSVVAEHGFFPKSVAEVPAGAIEALREGTIVLRVTQKEVESTHE